jgi:hypothetical protein
MDRMDFRLPGGTRHNHDVDTWMAEQTAELGTMAQEWFHVMQERGDDVLELMHDGCPVACVGDAPFGYVNAFKAHVNVGFFHGATLPDPAGLLEGSGKYMRHVKLRPGADIDYAALGTLIDAAYCDLKARLDAD